eukprot:UN05565
MESDISKKGGMSILLKYSIEDSELSEISFGIVHSSDKKKSNR